MTNLGFHFDNTYHRLPKALYSKLSPLPVPKPELAIVNLSLAADMGLDFSEFVSATVRTFARDVYSTKRNVTSPPNKSLGQMTFCMFGKEEVLKFCLIAVFH